MYCREHNDFKHIFDPHVEQNLVDKWFEKSVLEVENTPELSVQYS